LHWQDNEREISGAEPDSTNNRMELTAAIEALRALRHSCEVKLTTDSVYVRDGITKWLANWERNGWRTAAKKPVKNKELWQALSAEVARHDVKWFWVKGHSGHPENERADQLANRAIDELELDHASNRP
ncbi:MAG: ribonuclease HI, partial [Cellvibrionales bacterium]|nr:ribonuclease HI [Cellvibrionales bacterium]